MATKGGEDLKRSVLLKVAAGGVRCGGEGDRAGCKPHKVILQNVYAKRFRTR